MIRLQNLSLRRGNKLLFEQGNGTIYAGQRFGITGANGSGKSSLLALLRGQLQADNGDVDIPQQLTIAHVRQETPALAQTALDYVLDGDQKLRQLQARITELTETEAHEQLAESYEDMQNHDGYSAESRAARLLHGLGFKADDIHRSVKEFSGGWRMRLNLAQALMCPSDLLLLDEPTNHLDLEAVLWLEDWLKSYPGTLLVISHDRDFLDAVVNHVLHIESQGLHFYTGNYSTFEHTKAAQLATQQAQYEKQQRQIAHMQSYIDRFRYKASKARQAQARVKALDRMERISAAQLDSPFHFSFLPCDTHSHQMIKLQEANIGYEDTPVLSDVDLIITAGDRIGLLGYNGAGKSTLIKALCGTLDLMQGERNAAKNIRIGYFAQHQLDQLQAQSSALDHLQQLDTQASEQSLRDFLGGFAFRGDVLAAPVESFSGGEKARLVLAMLVYQRPDLLLLDEPTNHLDMKMRHALSMALQSFAGAMVLVSHDRHLLNTVTDRWVLVDRGSVSEFSGDLEDYRQYLREQQLSTDEKTQSKNQKNNNRSKIKPLRNKLQRLEKELAKLSTNKQRLEQALHDDSLYTEGKAEQLKQLLSEQQDNQTTLNQVEQDWLECSEQLEALGAE